MQINIKQEAELYYCCNEKCLTRNAIITILKPRGDIDEKHMFCVFVYSFEYHTIFSN